MCGMELHRLIRTLAGCADRIRFDLWLRRTVALPDGEVMPVDKRFDRREADKLFLELMAQSKIAYRKCNVAYLAVRAFGGSSWRQG